jgi:hypothetical protein
VRIPSIPLQGAGHEHFWERAGERGVTRGGFLTKSAGAVGAAAGLAALSPGTALGATDTRPKPIPGGLHPADLGLPVPPFPEILHVEAPGVATLDDSEPITVTDFNGNIGYAVIDGSGTGRDTATGATKTYSFNVDMRFMKGASVAEDGRVRQGTFGFI